MYLNQGCYVSVLSSRKELHIGSKWWGWKQESATVTPSPQRTDVLPEFFCQAQAAGSLRSLIDRKTRAEPRSQTSHYRSTTTTRLGRQAAVLSYPLGEEMACAVTGCPRKHQTKTGL